MKPLTLIYPTVTRDILPHKADETPGHGSGLIAALLLILSGWKSTQAEELFGLTHWAVVKWIRKLNKTGNPLKFSRDLESDWTVKNNIPHYGLKEHASVDTRYGFVLASEITPASFHDSPYLPLCVAPSCHTKNPIKKVFADKGYFGKDNRDFLHMNNIEDGIMRKATRGAALTQFEKERNKVISKVRYIVEQYFGISHMHQHAYRARFTIMIRNAIDSKFRQLAFNLFRGVKVLRTA